MDAYINTPKSDAFLDEGGMRKCCGTDPIFHQFTKLGLWAVECGKNGHIHNTGLCRSREEAARKWEEGELAK